MEIRAFPPLSHRERQIMDILLRRAQASAVMVQADLPDPPGYSAVRTMLARLEEKGYVTHEHEGPRYVYRPAIDTEEARASALERIVATFFDGSPPKTVAALLDRADADLSDEDLDELAQLIERKRQGRR
jgi:predicted transcriptional regulator